MQFLKFSSPLYRCDHILFSGIAESLKKLLTDPDTTVRQKSTECLFVIGCMFDHSHH